MAPAKPRKVPQDHKTKGDDKLYTFVWEDTTYELPPADGAVDHISGRQLRDAYMEGQEGQMRLGFAMLEHIDAEAAVNALYDMPAPIMLDHIQAWMDTRTKPEAATVGESSRSSA
jgi:hypothetical protein